MCVCPYPLKSDRGARGIFTYLRRAPVQSFKILVVSQYTYLCIPVFLWTWAATDDISQVLLQFNSSHAGLKHPDVLTLPILLSMHWGWPLCAWCSQVFQNAFHPKSKAAMTDDGWNCKVWNIMVLTRQF